MSAAIDFRFYLITDEESAAAPDRIDAALSAFPRGAAAIQLRARAFSARQLLDAAARLLEITRAHGSALFVNDRADVAFTVGADGVHLPVRGLPIRATRTRFPSLRIGASTHSLAEAQRAADAGADFVTFGPVFATPSKLALGTPVGLPALADTVAALAIPTFALGGIDLSTVERCVAAGARVACLRAVLGAATPADAAEAASALLHATSSPALARS